MHDACTLLNTVNPLTTNDEYSRHRNLAACYQLVQSVFEDRVCASRKGGTEEVGGCTTLADSA